MSKFFNIIGGKDAALILLYGTIGEYEDLRSGDIAREIFEAEQKYNHIDVRINSNGGDVDAGIAIFNALRNSKADIRIYIDGVAASIASVIAACGKPVYMSKYARWMIHGVSGGVYGNKEKIQSTLSEIEAIENDLCDIYSRKTGLTTEEIRTRYFDGADHWLKAQEALDLKFIDGIYDADPVPEDSTPEQIYNTFNNRYFNKNKSTMYENLKKRPRFANCADDTAIEAEIVKLEQEAEKAVTLETENATLKTENAAYKTREEEAHEAEIETVLQNARKEERFGEDEIPGYRTLLKANFEEGKAAIEKRAPKKRIMQNIAATSSEEKPSPWDARMDEIKQNIKK